MKKILCAVVIFSFILGGSVAFAAEKIGFVNIKEMMLNSDAGKESYKKLKKFVEEKEALIQEKEKDLRKLEEILKKQQTIMTEAAFKEKELDYQKKIRDLKIMVDDSKAEIQRKDQELSQKLIPEIIKISGEIGKKEGYSLILDVETTPGLVYYSKEQEITKKVLEAFDKIYKDK